MKETKFWKLFTPRISPQLSRTILVIALSLSLTKDASSESKEAESIRRCHWCGPLAEQVHRSRRAPPCDPADLHKQTTVCEPGYQYCAIVATSPPHVESRYCVKLYQDECYMLHCNSTNTWKMTCPCREDFCNGINAQRETEAFIQLSKLSSKTTSSSNRRKAIKGHTNIIKRDVNDVTENLSTPDLNIHDEENTNETEQANNKPCSQVQNLNENFQNSEDKKDTIHIQITTPMSISENESKQNDNGIEDPIENNEKVECEFKNPLQDEITSVPVKIVTNELDKTTIPESDNIDDKNSNEVEENTLNGNLVTEKVQYTSNTIDEINTKENTQPDIYHLEYKSTHATNLVIESQVSEVKEELKDEGNKIQEHVLETEKPSQPIPTAGSIQQNVTPTTNVDKPTGAVKTEMTAQMSTVIFYENTSTPPKNNYAHTTTGNFSVFILNLLSIIYSLY